MSKHQCEILKNKIIMRKYLSQIIGEATERLPKQNQVIGNYWSTTINDNIGGKVTVTFVKHYGGWNLLSTDY
nr:MAG TPA: hypothetical protein [Bacteriophage sp.]